MQAEGDLTMRQLSLIFETKDFFEFSHGDRPADMHFPLLGPVGKCGFNEAGEES